MKLLVQKFGGTSVSSDDRRQNALRHIRYALSKGYKLVVVVSAIGRLGDYYATDTLLQLVEGGQTSLDRREQDLLLSVGELISTAVFTNLLKKNGIKAAGFSGGDAGVVTNSDFGNAKIQTIDTQAILSALEHVDVVVVAGFQGRDNKGRVTTLGRGGSDTSAAFLASYLKAERCDIFTDVSGVMTADPRIVSNAHFMAEMSYLEVTNLANEGTKVIEPRAVEVAMQHGVPLRVRSTLDPETNLGTLITHQAQHDYRLVTGISYVANLVQFSVAIDRVSADKVLACLAKDKISLDFINIFPDRLLFTLPDQVAQSAASLLDQLACTYTTLPACAKVAVVGSGIAGVPGVVSKMMTSLSQINIPVYQSADSHTTIWMLIKEADLTQAVNALHHLFIEQQG